MTPEEPLYWLDPCFNRIVLYLFSQLYIFYLHIHSEIFFVVLSGSSYLLENQRKHRVKNQTFSLLNVKFVDIKRV